jgi:uncharacterized membrane protein YesL
MRPLLSAFARAAEDWWYGLIPFAVINLLWFGCVITVVAGPPATAALLAVARDAAVGQGAEPSTFFWTLRRLFWRSWALGLITAAGTLFLLVDLRFYSEALQGTGLLASLGIGVLGYIFLIWCEAVLIAWPLMVNQPEMALRDLLRNTAIFTLRYPGSNLGLALIVAVLAVFGFLVSFLIPLALGAFVALLVQHYLHVQAPILAAWPPRPGEEF